MSLFTVTRHTSYYVGTRAGKPLFQTSNRKAKRKPKLFTSFAAAANLADELWTWQDAHGNRPRVSKVRTTNLVLGA